MKLIYIAAPYRAATKERRDLQVQAAKWAGVLIAELGFMPVLPTVNTYRYDEYAPGLGPDFWLAGTAELLRRCDGLFLVPGWEKSKGCQREFELAQELNIPIYQSIVALGNTR